MTRMPPLPRSSGCVSPTSRAGTPPSMANPLALQRFNWRSMLQATIPAGRHTVELHYWPQALHRRDPGGSQATADGHPPAVGSGGGKVGGRRTPSDDRRLPPPPGPESRQRHRAGRPRPGRCLVVEEPSGWNGSLPHPRRRPTTATTDQPDHGEHGHGDTRGEGVRPVVQLDGVPAGRDSGLEHHPVETAQHQRLPVDRWRASPEHR